MDMTTSLASSISAMKAAETAYAASVRVMRNALNVERQTGMSMLNLLEGGEVNKADQADSCAKTGTNIDILA